MWQRTILIVSLFFLGTTSSEQITADIIQHNFLYLPLDVAAEMANKMNSVDDLAVKQEECEQFHSFHYWPHFYESQMRDRQPGFDPNNNYDEMMKTRAFYACMEMVYYQRFADIFFALLPKRKIVSLYKAAELKSLWLRILKANRRVHVKVYAVFRDEHKSLILPEKQESLGSRIEEAYRDAYHELKEFVKSKKSQ